MNQINNRHCETYIYHAKRLWLPIRVVQLFASLFDLFRRLLESNKRILNLEG